MVAITRQINSDPTLDAVRDQISMRADTEKRRPYLGMSSIGRSCHRESWYSFRWSMRVTFDVASLLRFADGHKQEDVMAERLRMVPGITLITEDPNKPGQQIGYVDFGGHYRGHQDGHLEGLMQAPKTPHVWEHKSVNEKKFLKLKELATTHGEKSALKMWDETYYAQHVQYMDYGGYTRGYLTCSTPGGRDFFAVRTEADPKYALTLRMRARQIIFEDAPPPRIGKVDFYTCKMCAFKPVCHDGEAAERNCRTCAHVTPTEDGRWDCSKYGDLTYEMQATGCGDHRYNPSFVPGDVVAADAAGNWIEYRMQDGRTWKDVGI